MDATTNASTNVCAREPCMVNVIRAATYMIHWATIAFALETVAMTYPAVLVRKLVRKNVSVNAVQCFSRNIAKQLAVAVQLYNVALCSIVVPKKTKHGLFWPVLTHLIFLG